ADVPPATESETTASSSPETPVASASASQSASDTATPAPPVAAAAPPPAPAPALRPGVGSDVLALVNAARASAGCAPLVADGGLAAVAQAHSADMRDRDFFSHVDPDGLDTSDRARQGGQRAVEG